MSDEKSRAVFAGDMSSADREMLDRLAEAWADAVNSLTGMDRGRIAAFRLYGVVSNGKGSFLPMTLAAICDEAREDGSAFDQMLDHAEETRRTQAPVGFFYRDDNGRN